MQGGLSLPKPYSKPSQNHQVKAIGVSALLLVIILSIYCWKREENAEAELKIDVKM